MRETLGDTHPATLVNIVQLGLVVMAKKEFAGAEQLLSEALTACRENFGDAHPQTLASITHLASLYEAKGELETALPLHQEVLAGFEATGHPMTLRCADHVASLLRQVGQSEAATALIIKYRGVDPNESMADVVEEAAEAEAADSVTEVQAPAAEPVPEVGSAEATVEGGAPSTADGDAAAPAVDEPELLS
jgi:ATP/maltotriose-dependent transcriptional regulator MalT